MDEQYKNMNGVIVGKIVKISGIHGYLKVQPLTNDCRQFAAMKKIYLDENCSVEKKIAGVVVNDFDIRIKFENIDTTEKAQKLVNFFLYVAKQSVKPLPNDAIYYFELAESMVEYEKGRFTEIKEIMETQSLVYLLVEVEKKEYMIPFNKYFIGEIDKKNKKIEIKNFCMIEGNEI